jgi:hypothetical protein
VKEFSRKKGGTIIHIIRPLKWPHMKKRMANDHLKSLPIFQAHKRSNILIQYCKIKQPPLHLWRITSTWPKITWRNRRNRIVQKGFFRKVIRCFSSSNLTNKHLSNPRDITSWNQKFMDPIISSRTLVSGLQVGPSIYFQNPSNVPCFVSEESGGTELHSLNNPVEIRWRRFHVSPTKSSPQ